MKQHFRASSVWLVCTTLCLFGPTALAVEEDPWEGFNRGVHSFNDTMDRYLLKPVAVGYQKVTPQPIDDGISNFFNNLGEFKTFANCLLQAKAGCAANTTARFMINSTFGLLGVMDVASKAGLPTEDEDFGQTLAVWGVGSGPFVMLPFFGPSTIRDAGSKFVDLYADPLTYVDEDKVRYGLTAIDLVDTRADLIAAESLLSGDRYIFMRDAYLQRRDFLIKDGEIEEDPFGDFDDESYDDEDESW